MTRAAPLAALLLALGSAALAGCGLQPLYASGRANPVAGELAQVRVAAIPGRGGWLVRNALNDRLSFTRGGAAIDEGSARYRLDVRLDDQLQGLGLLSDDTTGRERRTLRARYQLVDLATGAIVIDATDGTDAGIDVVSSEYATIAAEERALENLAQDLAQRIVTRLSLRLRAQP
ncbi:MAG: hypothetical protein DI591_08585 [Citromicrobium sp.]|nr:MAG: hypothetical protein DI591_08585 [Citromicrobium sp.]